MSCLLKRPGYGIHSATSMPTVDFRIDGVTGPDEYSALADNNVYTNLMAQHNLRAAAEAVKRYPTRHAPLTWRADEVKSWRDAAKKMFMPYDEHLGVTPQDRLLPSTKCGISLTPAPEQISLAAALPVLRPLSQTSEQAG